MLQKRLSAAYAVRDTYLPLKISTSRLKADAVSCLQAMEAGRVAMGLKVGEGADEIATMAEAIAMIARAEQRLASLHPAFEDLLRKAGLRAFYQANGGYGDEETHPFTTGLRAA